MFGQCASLNEQWILFKAYLSTAHSLQDNDPDAKQFFKSDGLLDFSLVLRNIIHHQPAKMHYGKHHVQPTGFSFSFGEAQPTKFEAKFSLVIEKETLKNVELQQVLGKKYPKQLVILNNTLENIHSHVIYVQAVIEQMQSKIEEFCKSKNKYTKAFDSEPLGFVLTKNV